MRDRLSEPNALPHALAVSSDFAIGGIGEVHAVDGFPCELAGLSVRKAAQQQSVEDKFESGNATREGIKLGAVTQVTKEFFGVIRRDAQHADVALCWADEAGQQVHERGLA